MKYLVFGKNGQVATEIRNLLSSHDYATFLGRDDIDFLTPDILRDVVQRHSPDVVINASAWTDVDAAESNEVEATLINAVAPGVISRACFDFGIPFLHISTDYVFSGSNEGAYEPSDLAEPKSAYGRSKLLGEQHIISSGCHYFILRTSRIFSSHGKNFVKTILQLAQDQNSLSIVSDQIGGPTPARAIAEVLIQVAKKLRYGQAGGTFHFSGFPDVSWSDFARNILEAARLNCSVLDIQSSEYPAVATRPMESRLDCSSLELEFGIVRPDWRIELKNVLKDLRLAI